MRVILLLKQERLGLLITENRGANTEEKAGRRQESWGSIIVEQGPEEQTGPERRVDFHQTSQSWI